MAGKLSSVCVRGYFTADFASQNTAIAIIAASRLVFAVARDGVLPFAGWVSRVKNGQPRNAVIVVWAVAAIVTCSILPSSTAFTSLVSAAGVPSAAAYGLICLGRLLCTPKRFPKPQWSLGRWSKPFQFIGVFWNGWVVAILFSPYAFPVTAENLNCTLFFLICLYPANFLDRCPHYHGWSHHSGIDLLLRDA
mgnify:FL=1|jgi:amino acid transporter